MNLTRFCDRIDHVYNLLYIDIKADPQFIAFIKKYQTPFEILTVFTSFIMISSFAFMMRYINSGLQLHVHLRRLIYATFGSFVLYRIGVDGAIILRHIYPMDTMCVTFGIQQNLILLKILEIFGALVFTVFLMGFNIERVVATIWIHDYETWSSWLLIISIVTFVVLIAFAMTLMLIFVNNSLFYTITAILILGACELATYFYYMSINVRLYGTRVTSEIRMTLSQRYQLSENLRILRFTRCLFLVYWFFNFVVFSVFTVYYITEDIYITILLHFVHQLSVLIYGTAIMISLMVTGAFPTVRELCEKLRGKKMNLVDDTARMFSIKSSMGEQMVFHGNQEADLYFIQLEQSWAARK
uniref:G protein-coupled receptor n=1 Tax=Panagrellus redivivus TaxID=6233 RepID=A0A7E4ZZ09_PANRE